MVIWPMSTTQRPPSDHPGRSPMQPDLIGGRYRVRSPIGRGGMGTVWLCRDEKLQRDVAVKQVGRLPGESMTDSARALREARSSAALSHRNVVTVFDVVEESDAIWLVMEYVPSRSLSEIIREDGPLDPAVVAQIGAQIADGLAAAHALGTVHRDVKPGNVLIREDGVPKISDFGIARNAADPALTQSGFVTGTPSYFSPELATGHAPSPAADVRALGATPRRWGRAVPPGAPGWRAPRRTSRGRTRSRCCTTSPRNNRHDLNTRGSSSSRCAGCSTGIRALAGRWPMRRTACTGWPGCTPPNARVRTPWPSHARRLQPPRGALRRVPSTRTTSLR